MSGGSVYICNSTGNTVNTGFSFTCGVNHGARLFKPLAWCGKQWTDWAALPKPDESTIGKIVQKMALFVPLIFATLIASFIGIVGLVTSGCHVNKSSVSTPTIIGSNRFIEKTFDLGSDPIHSIHLSSTGTLAIEPTKPGEGNSLEIRVEDNLLDLFTPKLQNHKLALGSSSIASICSHGIHYTLKVASSPSHLTISGDGEVQIGVLNTPAFHCEITGSGEVVIQAGEVESQVIEISGSGNYQAPNFKAKHSRVDVFGSGNVNLQALATLSVTISGSGRCSYLGSPKVSSRISGSGEIVKKDLF